MFSDLKILRNSIKNRILGEKGPQHGKNLSMACKPRHEETNKKRVLSPDQFASFNQSLCSVHKEIKISTHRANSEDSDETVPH